MIYPITTVGWSRISIVKKTIALLLIVVLVVVVAFPRVTSADRDGQGAQGQNHQSDDHDHGDHDNHGNHEGQSGDDDHVENQTEHDETEFEIRLTGAGQVPALNTAAFGRAEVELNENGTALRFEVQVCDIANVTASHIHVGNSTTNGPVILPFFKAGATTFSSTNGCSELAEGILTPANLIPNEGVGINNWSDFVNALRSGNTYVNVHTTAHPLGEIRGQLVGENEGDS